MNTQNYVAELSAALRAKKISASALANITKWLTEPEYASFQNDIINLIKAKDWAELDDAFFQVSPFGTAGRRGKMGVGPNRMNERTITEGAQGMAEYVKEKYHLPRIIAVIAYDTRHRSREFALATAEVFCAHGIETYVFSAPRATPELSFAIRALHAQTGVVISASHNPPEYNGFKAYNAEGYQYVHPEDERIMRKVGAVKKITTLPRKEAEAKKLLRFIDARIDAHYITAVLKQSPIKRTQNTKAFPLVFSALHGTAMSSLYPVLVQAGFPVKRVVEQCRPDPNFSTVDQHFPNPERVPVYDAALRTAQKYPRVQLLLVADPDADRLGAMYKDRSGKFIFLDGNQIGALITQFLATAARGAAAKRTRYIVKTTVTSDLITAIACAHAIQTIGYLPVGMKYIADTVHTLIARGESFLFGGEESHGFLIGEYCREKDAAAAGLLLAQYAAALNQEGKTLGDALDDLYRTYGYFCFMQRSISFSSAQGLQQMATALQRLKSNAFKKIGALTIHKKVDGAQGEAFDYARSKVVRTYPENSLVLLLDDSGGNRVTIRPSGTEPKMKIYVARFYSPAEVEQMGLDAAKLKAERNAEGLAQTIERLLV